MNSKTSTYLDLTALPAVGAALLGPNPAWVFGDDGREILWANAAGARFFNVQKIDALLDRQIGGSNPIANQLARLARILPTSSSRMEILRFASNFKLSALPSSCRRINLSDGQNAVLVVSASNSPAGSVASRAEILTDALAGHDRLAAVVDSDRRIVGASNGFRALGMPPAAIDGLLGSMTSGETRIATQPIQIDDAHHPVDIIGFQADGQMLVLLVVGSAEEERLAVTEVARTDIVSGNQPAPITNALATPAFEPSQSTDPTAPVIRFLWQVDQDQRFTFVSDELARLVGKDNAELIGRTWREIAERLTVDPEGRVQAALDAQTHWTGIKTSWPTAAAGQRISVELSAFPIAERGVFIGYRGLGILRPSDVLSEPPNSADEPELSSNSDTQDGRPDALSPTNTKTHDSTPADNRDDADDVARKSIEHGLQFVADRAALPDSANEPPQHEVSQTDSSNVVRLPGAPQTLPTNNEPFSGSEQDAFRRIAETLGVRREKDQNSSPASSPETSETAARGQTKVDNDTPAQSDRPDTRILDRLPVGIVVFRGDTTLFANHTILNLLGYDDRDDFATAGGSEAVFQEHDPAWANSQSVGEDAVLTVRRKDGSQLAVEARLQSVNWSGASALMLALREPASRPEPPSPPDDLVNAIATAEARLGELETILDTATDGVIVIDGLGRICNLNRSSEALFGIEAGEVLGTPFTDLLAEESRKAALDYLDGLASNGVASVLNDGREVIGKVPQGGLIPMFMTMGRLGQTGKFCAVLRDITHWKNVEEELVAARREAETANTQKSEFLAKISHEIRTPLNAIIGFSEVMMEERFGPIGNARYRDYLRDIHMSGSHLMSLINDLLDLSKIEAGKLELTFEAVAVNQTIQECVALMQPQANQERIIIRTSLSANVPDIVADPRSLRQILLNLLSNAIKFTKAGGQVIVSTTTEASGEVAIRVRDTGVGMSEKDVETALMPFRQLATSGRERGEGTGLGLPLTKALVEANRASFVIDSTVDQGTLVKITFPTTRVLAG